MPLIFKNQTGAQRFRMPWGAAIGAVGSIAAASMSKDKNGGAGTQTNTKEPWLPAQGWIMDNLNSGKALQQRYTDQPFSTEQQNAMSNIYGQSDYMRSLVPSLLGQLGGQQVGFDPSNPTAKPKAWEWNGLLGGAPDLGQRSISTPPAAAAAVPKTDDGAGDFVNQGGMLNGGNMSGVGGIAGLLGTGKYGSFTYGQALPKPGSKEYRDMSAYFSNGGADPNNYYGHGSVGLLDYVPAGGGSV